MSAQNGKVPVGACVRASYQFLAQNWQSLMPAALIVGLADIGAAFLVGATGNGAGMLLAMALTTVARAVFGAAVLRLALRPGDKGQVGLGADEARLIGVGIAIWLMFLPLVMIVSFVLVTILAGQIGDSPEAMAILVQDPVAFLNAIETALSPTGEAALAAFMVIICLIAIWVGVRLSLVNAATIGERKMVILQSWSWTQGNTLRVVAAFFLTMLPPMFAATLVMSLLTALLGQGENAGALAVVIVAGVQGVLGAVAAMPSIALGGELYKGLRPPDFVAR